MGFVYSFLRILKRLWIILSETIDILRNLQQQKKIGGCPREFYYMFAHSSL